MRANRIVSVMLCIVTGFALTAFAAKVASAPDPSGLGVSNVTSNSITISWTSAGGTTAGFIVAYLEGTTDPAEQCLTGTQVNVAMNTSFVLNNLAAGTTVSFRVCAYNSKNQRSTGITVQGTTDGGTPAVAGISWQPNTVATSDDGESDTINVSLTKQPQDAVVINVASTDECEGVVAPAFLVFTSANWNQPQGITVTGVGDEGVVDGDVLYEIELAVDSASDSEYLTVDPVYVPAINWDIDGLIIISSEDTPKAIADRRTTISQIAAFSSAKIGNLELDINLTHSRMSDLSIELRGPTSTETLVYEGGQWKLADPNAFQGELVAGSWQLAITDSVRKETGTLHGWTLRVIPLKRTYIYRTIDGVDIHATVTRLGQEIQPVVMHMHHGAALFGHRDGTVAFVDEMWQNGYTVVSIDYRLCPAILLPEIIDDMHVAYAWVRANGTNLFNVDTNRIGVTGSSMGGFLTMLAGYQLTPRPVALCNIAGYSDLTHARLNQPNPDYLANNDLVSEEDAWAGFDLDAVLTNCRHDGNDPEFLERAELWTYLMQQGLWPQMITGLDPVADVDIFNTCYNAHYNVTSDYPPTVFVHGALDVEVEVNQSIIMDAALADAEVDSELIIAPDGVHLLWNLPLAEQAPYWQQARLFLDQYLK